MEFENLDIVTLTESSITCEHICCGFSDKKSAEGYQLKKDWLCNRFKEGFQFTKFDIRGKAFIEYTPAEFAWRPIDAPGYLCIHCFWVSGRYKGHGLGKQLLHKCLKDAERMNGIVAITSSKTVPFLTDKGFFIKQGFEVCDTAEPYFEMVLLPLRDAPLPRFRETARHGKCEAQNGVVLYYTNQCPFTEYYVDEMLTVADSHGLPGRKIKLDTRGAIRNGPSPSGIFGAYYNGLFLTQEIMSRNKFDKTLTKAIAEEE